MRKLGREMAQGVCQIDLWVYLFLIYALIGSFFTLTAVETNTMLTIKMAFLAMFGIGGLAAGHFISPLAGPVKHLVTEEGFYGKKGLKEEMKILSYALVLGLGQLVILWVAKDFLKLPIAAAFADKTQSILFYTSAAVFEEFLFTFLIYRFLMGVCTRLLGMDRMSSFFACALIVAWGFMLFHWRVYGQVLVYLVILFILRFAYLLGYEQTGGRLSFPIILHVLQNFGSCIALAAYMPFPAEAILPLLIQAVVSLPILLCVVKPTFSIGRHPKDV